MSTATTTARTGYGDLRGTIDRGVTVFRGVPYARPPVGPLRFVPPQPPDTWTGVRDATAFGPPAMQGACAPAPGLTVTAPQSEDCLTLNVWTPAMDDARRPVMVYLHGGAFMVGSGSMTMYHGATLARRGDVVVVTINYRLGLFGYLRGVDVCGEALPSTGNAGLLDQIAALKWVKQEIAAFGGDPDNVTVFGQSAGSSSIYAMLSMPRARGLFHKAILQSGAMQVQVPAAANRVMEAILDHIGLEPHEAGRLRDLTAAELLDIQTRATPRAGGSAYRPVADGIDVPIDPEAAIAAGSAAGIPLLVGTNLEEWRFFIRLDPEAERLTDDGLLTRLADPRTNAQAADNAQFDPAEAVTMHRQARAARGESTTAWDLWVAIMSNRRFRVPSMRLAERHSMHTPETYAYLFTWESPGWDGRLGTGHEIQVPFVFGTLDASDSRDLVPAGSPVGALPELMQDAWVAFARTGSPRTQDLPDWDAYSAHRRRTMILGTSCGAVDAPFEQERRFWATHAGTSGTRPSPVI